MCASFGADADVGLRKALLQEESRLERNAAHQRDHEDSRSSEERQEDLQEEQATQSRSDMIVDFLKNTLANGSG